MITLKHRTEHLLLAARMIAGWVNLAAGSWSCQIALLPCWADCCVWTGCTVTTVHCTHPVFRQYSVWPISQPADVLSDELASVSTTDALSGVPR